MVPYVAVPSFDPSVVRITFIIGVLGLYLMEAAGKETLDEPAYHQLLYGSVWKHIIFSPHDSSDILEATKHLSYILREQSPSLDLSTSNLKCISQHVLWYTETQKSPVFLESYVYNRQGHKNPVSVPVSLGSTFHYLLTIQENGTSTSHAFTITKDMVHVFHLYSHIFHSEAALEASQEDGRSCFHERIKHKTSLVKLSSLALSKQTELYPEIRCLMVVNARQLQQSQNKNGSLEKDISFNEQSVLQSSIKADRETGKASATLKVMSYNIWNFNTYQQKGQYSQRVKRMAQLLRQNQPDIIGFQEVRFEQPSGEELGPNQIKHLSSALPGYQFIYQPAQLMRDSFQQGRTEEGLAIFSKYPVIHHDYILLFRLSVLLFTKQNQHNSADQHQRICLHATIHIPSVGIVHVFNTHFSLSHEAREVAVSQILQFMKEVGEEEPALLLGDLNATPEENAIRMLTHDTGLVDVWDKLYPRSQGFTFNNLEDELSKRIDYIFVKKSDNMTALKMEVIADNIKSNAASDHRPMMATLHLQA